MEQKLHAQLAAVLPQFQGLSLDPKLPCAMNKRQMVDSILLDDEERLTDDIGTLTLAIKPLQTVRDDQLQIMVSEIHTDMTPPS